MSGIGNQQKTPLYETINRAIDKAIAEAFDRNGKVLPASIVAPMGNLVKVQIEVETSAPIPQITMPLAMSEYVRIPLKAGVGGIVIPASARLGPVSGLGGSRVSMTPPGNLGALVFVPISNKGWEAPFDENMLELYGPDGVVIRNGQKTYYLFVTDDGISLGPENGAVMLTIDGAGVHVKGPLIVDGNLQLNGVIQNFAGGPYSGAIITSGIISSQGIQVAAHRHGGVTTGGGFTVNPVTP